MMMMMMSSIILKKLERCVSMTKKKKKTKGSQQQRRVSPTPMGCFSVYVGPQKQRFVIKTECVNHPSFKILLQDAELEYGFTNKGPLLLPCQVDFFVSVLAQMEYSDFDDDDDRFSSYGGSCSPFNPARPRLGKTVMAAAQGCGSYHLIQTRPTTTFSSQDYY